MANTPLNPRLNPYKDTIAAAHLKGKVEAGKFVEGTHFQISAPITGVYRDPIDDAMLDTQALMGESFIVYDKIGDWSWGQLQNDKYVGWIQSSDLSDVHYGVTHKVGVLRTIVFSEPDLKTKPLYMLSLNSRVAVEEVQGLFSKIVNGGWVFSDHLFNIGETYDDFVSVAEMFQDAPYLWGGKDSFGLDCSGLVQTSMAAAGINVPRDAGMQEAAEILGQTIPVDHGVDHLQRGDLIFWPGHVGIMQNNEFMLHANAHHMMCASEPVSEAIERIGQKETAVRTIKRPSQLYKA